MNLVKTKINIPKLPHTFCLILITSHHFIFSVRLHGLVTVSAQANYSSSHLRDKWLCVTFLGNMSVTTQTGCGAEQSTSVCVSVFAGGSRQCVGFSRSHAYLYESFAEGGCPSDSVLHGSWPSKTNSIETPRLVCWVFFSMCHLCVCYCGICTSSITDTRGLSVLKAKSQCKPHLVSKQSGNQTQHIFRFVDWIF